MPNYQEMLDRCGPPGGKRALYGPALNAWIDYVIEAQWTMREVAHARGCTPQTARAIVTRRKKTLRMESL